ncbi:dep domain protein [Holotrichia oblita]|uniref:Dep domain protein n=1 Tax=Holotrichia oblita TaxID=644536 RepID=A0ACB9SIJ1_HOLOL|nr:dep domain protein [Holotrichia oblita]
MMAENSGAALDNLYPALAQCFVIIICGYFAGRMNLISETEAKGINTFVGNFALPSLIFMSLAELDLSSVNWLFLLSILIAKSLVFFTVIIVTLLVGRPVNLGRAGIFAIFCTQSNDFAIGYPIVVALYKNTHPEYASYLYLMAPISLAILNPMSFVLMEIGKRRSNQNLSPISINSIEGGNSTLSGKRCKLVISVSKSIFLNPIIFMTLLGIIGNLIFNHTVPIYLSEILKALGSAFSASALFLLGLRMVGKVHTLRGATLIIPGILIIVKLLCLPIVTREVINIVHAGFNESETTDLSTYGFLYGTFPAAPTVFVFATQFSLDVDLIASAMVACTFISAPLMFVSAKMITLTDTDPEEYVKQLNNFTFDLSVIGVVASVWVLALYILTKKITRVPHKITSCLIISQILACIGAILWNSLENKTGWAGYVQFALFCLGVYSSRLWTAILAVVLLFLQCRSLCFVLKLIPVFFFIGWGLPLLMSILLLLYGRADSLPYEAKNPNFAYGVSQAVVAVSLLVLCFIITVGCLILHQRYRKRYERYLNLANDVASTFEQPHENGDARPVQNTIPPPVASCSGGGSKSGSCKGNKEKCGNLPTINEGCCEDSPVVDIEDVGKVLSPKKTTIQDFESPDLDDDENGLCSTKFGCTGPRREECQGILQRYEEQIDDDVELIEEEPDTHDPQILRHVVLLIMLLCSMFVGLALCIWTLVMEQMSGIYIELSFLDATLNFGQSIIIFAVFGTNTKEIVLPLLKYWRKMWYGANTLVLPSWDELSVETKHICDQFVTHHLQKCKDDIAQDKRWRIKIYKKVFSGSKFVDWLIEVGLARDRIEAVNYARHLIEGKVLRHINSVHHFYDRNLLYTLN